MNDLEEDLSRSLAATAADTDVHVERLLDHALTAGTRYRRRRRLLAGGGTALAAGLGVALVVGAVSVGLPHHGAGTGVQAGASGQPTPPASQSPPAQPTVAPTAETSQAVSRLPELPLATGVPSVLQSPGQVGDPRYLHASIDPALVSGNVVEWATFGDQERLSVQGNSDPDSNFTLTLGSSTRDMDPLSGTRSTVTVHGKSAQYALDTTAHGRNAVLRWQPAPGLWAELTGTWSAPAAQHLAEQIRFDRTYVCPSPFQVTNAPAKASRATCMVTVVEGVTSGIGAIAVGSWDVVIETEQPVDLPMNTTLGGHPAWVEETPGDGGHKILQINVDYGGGKWVNLTAEGPYDAAAVKALAGSLQLATDPDPAHWPTSPLP